MNDVLKQSQFESRLPDDRPYWDEFAAKIVDSAESIMREHHELQSWWDVFSKWSPAIGVAATATALVVGILGPPTAAPPAPVLFEQLLTPENPVAQAVVAGGRAADISTMLLVESGGQP